MNFKVGRKYSNRTIHKHCKNICTFGEFKGGEHTIESNSLKFVMLLENAWRGTNSFYYKCIKI
jgi:hypothetical protein